MAMYINTNVTSLFAQRSLNNTQNSLSTSLERLSSGLRINSAKDDAAGLAISNRMTSQIDGLNQAVLNANAGNAVAQTAGGALDQVTSILQRIRTLAVESANDSNTSSDRQSMQTEVDQLTQELGQIASTTTFNGEHILDGSVGTLNFQVGANANETVSVNGLDVRTTSLGDQAGMTETTTGRISTLGTGANTGTLGISSAAATTSITSQDFTVKIAGMSSVNIAETQYGGTISSTAMSSLTDVNSADYGEGLAKDIAARINDIREMDLTDTGAGVSGTYLQGVYASATTTFTSTDMTSAASYGSTTTGDVASSDYAYVGAGSLTNGALNINGVDIGAVSFQQDDASGTLTAAINAKSDQTGVTASINSSGGLVLTASDGRDIVLNTNSTAATNTLFAGGGIAVNGTAETSDFDNKFTNMRITGEVSLSAQNTISLDNGATGTAQVGGMISGTDLAADNVQATGTIANANVTTVDNANETINAVDSALDQVNTMNATLGAIQNRFTATIANLQSISENVSSARSNILDADFASETANLSKAQILQQAGVAMVAQANSLPQSVLSLLK